MDIFNNLILCINGNVQEWDSKGTGFYFGQSSNI
jgi:hypothetical protein